MNKNILSNVIMFAAGAAVGSVVTWRLLKTKYESIVQEDVESVRAAYEEMLDDNKKDDEETEENDEEDDTERDAYEDLIYGAGYAENEEGGDDEVVEPYVIVPEEFDENGYETVNLYYYENGVVETLIGREVLDDETIEKWIGKESLTHFGEYEDDSVFVRNDDMRTDFEILRVFENYSEDD